MQNLNGPLERGGSHGLASNSREKDRRRLADFGRVARLGLARGWASRARAYARTFSSRMRVCEKTSGS